MMRAWAVAIAGALLILAALTFDASVLLVPGGALVVLGLLVPPWIRIAARAGQAVRVLHGDRVVEDQPLEATIEVRRGRLGLPGGEVVDQFTGGTMVLGRHRYAGARAGSTVRVVARFPRRGRRRFEPPALVLQDPLGLARVRRPGPGPAQELLVLPRTEQIVWAERELGDRVDSPTLAVSPEAFAATEVDGLRPYRPGAPASRIHWPALARGGGVLEKRLRSDGDTGPLVLIDARSPGPAERLDAAVRAAASLALELARRSGCELLLPGERRPIQLGPDLAAWPNAHARLALIEGGLDVPPPGLAARPRAGRVYYVAAQWPDRPASLGLDGRLPTVLVVPSETAAGVPYASLFDVAGCRAFALGARRRHPPREDAA
jgi:uncharacterized protein (DUF58 family)